MSQSIYPILLLLFGVLLLWLSFKLLFRTKWFIAWMKGSFGVLLFFASALLVFAAYDLAQFDVVLIDEPIATISFAKRDRQNFDAELKHHSGKKEQFRITGDLWEISVRFTRFEAPFGLPDPEPLYQWDRLEGRYYSVSDELEKPRKVYDLHKDNGVVDTWGWGRKLSELSIVALHYGSGTYLPMADGSIYRIYMTNSGIYAKPENVLAQDAVEDFQEKLP